MHYKRIFHKLYVSKLTNNTIFVHNFSSTSTTCKCSPMPFGTIRLGNHKSDIISNNVRNVQMPLFCIFLDHMKFNCVYRRVHECMYDQLIILLQEEILSLFLQEIHCTFKLYTVFNPQQFSFCFQQHFLSIFYT